MPFRLRRGYGGQASPPFSTAPQKRIVKSRSPSNLRRRVGFVSPSWPSLENILPESKSILPNACLRRCFGRQADFVIEAEQRAQIIGQLAERGIDFQTLAIQAGKPDADPFDLLCHLAYNAPVLTRRQRADRVKWQQAAFFGYFAPEAREILNDLLEKYTADGELQFTLPDVLKVPLISQHGNVAEIIGKFGGADQLRNAVN